MSTKAELKQAAIVALAAYGAALLEEHNPEQLPGTNEMTKCLVGDAALQCHFLKDIDEDDLDELLIAYVSPVIESEFPELKEEPDASALSVSA